MVQEARLTKELGKTEGKSKEELTFKTATTKTLTIMTTFKALKNMVEDFKQWS